MVAAHALSRPFALRLAEEDAPLAAGRTDGVSLRAAPQNTPKGVVCNNQFTADIARVLTGRAVVVDPSFVFPANQGISHMGLRTIEGDIFLSKC